VHEDCQSKLVLCCCQVLLGNCARVYRRTEETVAAICNWLWPSSNWRLVKTEIDHCS